MGKRKTLREKQRTDTKRQQVLSQDVPPSSPTSQIYSFSSVHKHIVSTPAALHSTAVHDVRKTAFISLAIVALQIVLFTLLQNHVLALPFVRY
jgi:hypothetical protein